MTRVEQAIERLLALPAAEQEIAVEDVLAVIERVQSPSSLSPQQIEEVRQLEAELDAGRLDVLTEAEAEALWLRLGA